MQPFWVGWTKTHSESAFNKSTNSRKDNETFKDAMEKEMIETVPCKPKSS